MFKKNTEKPAKNFKGVAKKLARIASIVGMCALIIATSVYFGLTLNVVSITEGSSTKTVYTLKSDVRGILGHAGYSDNYKVVATTRDGNKIAIEVEESFPVYITYGDKTVTHLTSKATAGDILTAAGITVNQGDMVSVDLKALVEKETYIDIVPEAKEEAVITVTKQEEKVEKDKNTSSKKPTTSSKPATSSKPSNSSSVTSSGGSLGKVTYPGAGKSPISELTPASPIALDENGIPINYKSCKRVQATAYTHTGNKCSTGVWPKPGYIAVDPKVIPYGTKMYIVSADGKYVYGYAIAADTGGFIKKRPTNVDLFFHTEKACRTFGRRDVIIYFL